MSDPRGQLEFKLLFVNVLQERRRYVREHDLKCPKFFVGRSFTPNASSITCKQVDLASDFARSHVRASATSFCVR